jgi:methylphosphotriester-DNA--protein-cysteine methyltransferase
VTVYVTNTGKKYHTGSCSYLSKSKIAISLSDAKAQGYGPCSRCNPPQ